MNKRSARVRARGWILLVGLGTQAMLGVACNDDEPTTGAAEALPTDGETSVAVDPSTSLPVGSSDASGVDSGGAGEAGVRVAGEGSGLACAPSAAIPYERCDEQPEDPTIADFEGESSAELIGSGGWFSFDDGTDGSLVATIEAQDNDNAALYATSSNWTMWGSGLGVMLHPEQGCTRHCLLDASSFDGVRFRARGVGRMRVLLSTGEHNAVAQGGSCELAGENCFDFAGSNIDLTSDWQTFSLPFCSLLPEGWGRSVAGFELDTNELANLQLRFASGQQFELWLDDLELYAETNSSDAGTASCQLPCPMDLVPPTAMIEPEVTYVQLSDELTLHTFEQETKSDCGSLTRRYLSYVPSELEQSSAAPVLFALHGSGANAESFQHAMARGGLDELAKREGFIVVYGNAAPGAFTDANSSPYLNNSGAWRQAFYDDGQVDDVEYLQLVLDDLRERQVIAAGNPVYLTGISNGGGMVLEAAKRFPDRFAGIAPFMPFDGLVPTTVPDLRGTGLKRVLFGYAPDDPGLPDEYTSVLSELPEQWAAALGFGVDAIEQPRVLELPDPVQEGEDYEGDSEAALKTRHSTAVQLDMREAGVDAAVRVLRFDGAGHLWPHPQADDEDWMLDRWGFRNQDLDASQAVWQFFNEPIEQ